MNIEMQQGRLNRKKGSYSGMNEDVGDSPSLNLSIFVIVECGIDMVWFVFL